MIHEKGDFQGHLEDITDVITDVITEMTAEERREREVFEALVGLIIYLSDMVSSLLVVTLPRDEALKYADIMLQKREEFVNSYYEEQ